MPAMYVCSRPWRVNGPQGVLTYHVESLKPDLVKRGAKGDWGYTTDSLKALHLTEYQKDRFVAYCRSMGVVVTVRKVEG